MAPSPVSARPSAHRTVAALAPAIYLAALVIPPLGSTVTWLVARRRTRERGLGRHLLRALRIQGAGGAAIALLQAAVLAGVWLAAPILHGPLGPALRPGLLVANLAAIAGIWLAVTVLGPVLLLAERRPGPTRCRVAFEPTRAPRNPDTRGR